VRRDGVVVTALQSRNGYIPRVCYVGEIKYERESFSEHVWLSSGRVYLNNGESPFDLVADYVEEEMKVGHKYAQALRWIADGENVQVRWCRVPKWMAMSECNEVVNDEVMTGKGEYEFRIAQRTITINGIKCEAPLREEPKYRQAYFVLAADKVCAASWVGLEWECDALKAGRVFATKEAAQAAYDAITSLLVPKE